MSSADILLHKKIEVENAITKLALARQMDAEVKVLKSQATEVLVPFMSGAGLKSLDSSTTNGSVTYIAPGVSKKFNKERAAQELLYRGVSAEHVQQAYDLATEINPRSSYVKFTPSEG